MRALLAISDALDRVCLQAARLAGLGLLVLTGVIIYDVVGRRYFATGSFKLQELEWHLHGAIAVLAFGYAYTRDAHVRIDILARRIPSRARLWMEVGAIALFLVPFMLLLAWYGSDFAWRSFERGEGSPGGIGLPHRWIIKAAIPVSAVLTLMGGVSVALRCLAALLRPDLRADPFERGGLWGPAADPGPEAGTR